MGLLIVEVLLCLLLLPVAAWFFAWKLPLWLTHVAKQAETSGRFDLEEKVLQAALKLTNLTDAMVNTRAIPRAITPRLHVMGLLSICYFRQGKHELVMEIDKQSLDLLVEAGDLSNAAAKSAKLAVDYLVAGDIDAALSLSERAVTIIKSAFRNSQGDNAGEWDKRQTNLYRAELAHAFFSQAWVLEVLRRYEQAEPLRKQALEIMEAHYGTDAYEITPHLNRLGCLYMRQGRLPEAKPLLDRCLTIRVAKNSSWRLINSAKEAVGEWYCRAGDLTEAAQYLDAVYAKTIDPASKVPKSQQGEIVVSIARLRFAQKSFDEAEKLLQSSIHDMAEVGGESNPRLLDGLELLVKTLEKLGKSADGEAFAARAEKIRQRWNIVQEDPTVAVAH